MRSPRRPQESPLEARVVRGHCLATAEITYRMPDHPRLLQTFVWQQFDIAPDYPGLRRFLTFWQAHLDGALHSVRVAHTKPNRQTDIRVAKSVFRLH